MLQYRRVLDLVEQLDRLGFDEFWCGEHHSTGWEVIASPEMFLAAAGERTHRIKLGTGVVSLPYHHPFHVAQRIVQLDYMTGGRALLGTGPGALASDAHTLGIDPMTLRDRQDEGITVLKRLLSGERFSYECDWFNMYDARLHILPIQTEIPMAVASMFSPSGMTLAGKHGIGILSLSSMMKDGMASLPLQWSFAEEAAAKHGSIAERRDWRIVLNWHLAETREEAQRQARQGLFRWINDYAVGVLNPEGGVLMDSPDHALEVMATGEGAPMVIGTPDDLVRRIREVEERSGGFGTVVGFVNDWASPENISRSWDLVARYVMPEVNGLLDDFRDSEQFVKDHREYFKRAGEAVMSKINENERAAAAFEQQGLGDGMASAPLPGHSHIDESEFRREAKKASK